MCYQHWTRVWRLLVDSGKLFWMKSARAWIHSQPLLLGWPYILFFLDMSFFWDITNTSRGRIFNLLKMSRIQLLLSTSAIHFAPVHLPHAAIQLPVSSFLRTKYFHPTFTQYCFWHLPLSITSDLEIVQKKVKWVCCFMDHIQIFGLTEEDHDHGLCEAMQTSQA